MAEPVTGGYGGWSPLPGAAGNLDDLSDVDTTTAAPSDGDSLVYDSASAMWVPGTVADGAAFSGVALTKSTGQSATSGTFVTLTWDTEDYDTDSFHSTSTNPSRITIPADGYYDVGVVVEMPIGSVDAIMRLLKNGADTGIWARQNAPSTNYPPNLALPAGALSLVSGDYLEASVRHSKGSTTDVATSNRNRFWAWKVG